MKRIVVWLALVLAPAGLGFAAPPAKPKLVVGIVIDQFRYDYLERFADLFGEGGFRRLMQEGAVFTDAQYLHSATVTAVGHATFMTGSIPSQHGIVANQWFERAEGKAVGSVTDDTVNPVGSSSGKRSSPWRLVGSTLGDELKLSNSGASRVIGISMKDAAAILAAGHHPDAAYWFDNSTGRFVTSTYYMKQLPVWVDRFNANRPAEAFFGKTWTKLRPEADYARSGIDDSPYEVPSSAKRTFPYTINNLDQLINSPFSNEVLAQFAKATIENENLGGRDVTDLLTISFSCNDEVGHEYGPYSQEVEDVTLRTDIVLADFFQYLDRKIGKDNYVVVLSADHGVAPTPEQARALGLAGGRFTDTEVTDFVSTELIKRFGPEKWIVAYQNEDLYLDPNAAARRHLSFAEVARAAADAALMMPQFAAAYTSEDFQAQRFGGDAISQRVSRNYFRGRSGDVLLIPKPYYLASKKTSTHGTPYNYDTNVPVILWGSWFVPGRYTSAASPADIAPTLASILHVTRPSVAVGRVLTEAVR